jgi:hypothetical protein
MLSKIHPLYFFAAFAIGMLVVYLTKPRPELIVKFPTPQNAENIIYKTDDDTCFKFMASKESCPTDKALIKPQPILS